MEKKETKEKEFVNHPEHYKAGKNNEFEHYKVVKALDWDFFIGNATKYLWRSGKKDKNKEVEDLRKSIWYIEEKIKWIEEQNETKI